jgi:two-component system cell cycle response regulator DivK
MIILVAEDFDDTRQMMKLLLEMRGHRVMEAANGQEAVEIATRQRPDLILMDLNMPVLDGISATRALQERPETAGVPVVAVTAHCGDPSWRERALEAGCVECVEKPVDFERLEGLLDRLLPKKSGAV